MLQLDLRQRPILRIHRHALHLIQRTIRPVNDASENGVFSVEVRLFGVGDEELGFVGVGAGVGHCDDAAGVELKDTKMSELQSERRTDVEKDGRKPVIKRIRVEDHGVTDSGVHGIVDHGMYGDGGKSGIMETMGKNEE